MYKELIKLVRRANWKKIFKENESFFFDMLEDYRKAIYEPSSGNCLYQWAFELTIDYDGDFDRIWKAIPDPDFNLSLLGNKNLFISINAFEMWRGVLTCFNFKEGSYVRIPLSVCEYLNSVYPEIVDKWATDDYKKFFQWED